MADHDFSSQKGWLMKLDQKINSKQVRELLGDISDMSLWRFLHDKKLGFPKPIYINRRRFWSQEELKQWLEQRPRIYVEKADRGNHK